MDILAKTAKERSTYYVTIAFLDENDAPFIPSEAAWKLTDMAGNIVNARDDVTISNLDTEVTLELFGDDLRNDSDAVAARLITIWGKYDSITYGVDKVFRQQCLLNIEPELG